MEKCTDGFNHEFNNSWGSFRDYGYVGMCRCTRIAHPSELVEAYKNNECNIEDMLIKQLVGHQYMTHNNYWYCQSCNDAISINVDRISHFIDTHNFNVRSNE